MNYYDNIIEKNNKKLIDLENKKDQIESKYSQLVLKHRSLKSKNDIEISNVKLLESLINLNNQYKKDCNKKHLNIFYKSFLALLPTLLLYTFVSLSVFWVGSLIITIPLMLLLTRDDIVQINLINKKRKKIIINFKEKTNLKINSKSINIIKERLNTKEHLQLIEQINEYSDLLFNYYNIIRAINKKIYCIKTNSLDLEKEKNNILNEYVKTIIINNKNDNLINKEFVKKYKY